MYCVASTGRENAKYFKEMYLLGDKERKPIPPFNLFERIPKSSVVVSENLTEIFAYKQDGGLNVRCTRSFLGRQCNSLMFMTLA